MYVCDADSKDIGEVVVFIAAAMTRGMLGSMFSLGLHPSSTWALSFMSLAA